MTTKPAPKLTKPFRPDPARSLALFDAFRRGFDEAIKRARQSEGSVSLAIVDLDWFSKLNATHGVPVGDAMLVGFAEEVREAFKGCGEVSRFGGDALSVVFEGVDKEDAFLKVEQMRSTFDRKHVVAESGKTVELPLTVSAGVSAYPDDGSQTLDVVRKANEALYRAKVSGRNKVCLAREEKMVTKTVHYTQGQLHGLSRLAKRTGVSEAVLLREAVDDVLRKYNA
ncbi:MAG: hypothetical protein AMXMBFR84_01570 [Candidatus Hydrogenedentota bacterium]